jgi:hypothetical protein
MNKRNDPFAPAPGPSNSVAWAALFLSFVALVLSGFVMFVTYRDGRLVENLKVLRDETSKIVESAKGRIGGEEKGEAIRWDLLRERVDRIETMVQGGDDRASYYADTLKKDLSTMKDLTTDKSASALSKAVEDLEEARGRMESDRQEASRILRRLSENMAPRVRSLLSGSEAEPVPGEPPAQRSAERGPEKGDPSS